MGGAGKEGRVTGVGQAAGLHGAAFDPYTMYDDATKPLQPLGFTLPRDMTLDRIRSRSTSERPSTRTVTAWRLPRRASTSTTTRPCR
ncbi:MAG: hypothetical protein CM1200mP2_27230 [Planctomycetaceae bacterium]|nr:MAG: hypothetical protein CM1200mP2_27230 [Planctomycetaceae bacterium]